MGVRNLKVLENFQKNILKAAFLLNNLTCLIRSSITILKLTPLQMFLVRVPRIFEIAGWASVMDTLFSKVTGEISAFYNIA